MHLQVASPVVCTLNIDCVQQFAAPVGLAQNSTMHLGAFRECKYD